MDTVLLIITLISAATAIVALASARRLRRAERERSEARVAALAHAADTHGGTDGGWTQVAGEWQWTPEPAAHRDQGSGFGISAARVTRRRTAVEPSRGRLVRDRSARGAVGKPSADLRGGGSDRDAGRRADFSEHLGVERSRGDRRAGEPHRAARAGRARTRARRQRADDHGHRPESVERRQSSKGSPPSSRCSIAPARSSPRKTCRSTTGRSARAKKRRSR